jgi:Ca2+-binding EF-hand superfamily protein
VNLFRVHDKDANGTISFSEFDDLIHGIYPGQSEETYTSLVSGFHAIDEDGSACLSFAEFLKWLQWIPMD